MSDRLRHFRATLANYRAHGWQLARVLMTRDALAELRREAARDADADADAETGGAGAAGDVGVELKFENVAARESDFDAMWFRRAAGGGREAWELRLAAEPYALFEMFEPDEAEEDRQDVRREMEARARMKAEG
ncbi:MAG: hypothetical protein LC746_02280 [Acidobacteria bacterium]|nr:hypothetical protein [Acidobacteriota bacterium]